VADIPGFLTAPVRPAGELSHILANFLGHRDRRGLPFMDQFLPLLSTQDQDWIFNLKRDQGITHILLCTTAHTQEYYPTAVARGLVPGSYTQLTDWRENPDAIRRNLDLVEQAGFHPILWLSSGDRGTGREVKTLWPRLLPKLTDYATRVVWGPGYEVVGTGGGWSSRELSDGLICLHDHFGDDATIFVHLTDRGYGFNSWPVESDDPWQDGMDSWITHGGQYVTGLFYQTESGDELFHPEHYPVDPAAGPDYAPYPGYKKQLYELSQRTLVGGRGWRKAVVCIGETIAEDFWHGRCTEDDMRPITRFCRSLGYSSFGNGFLE